MKLSPPAALEAILFASGEPIPKKRISSVLGIPEKDLREVIEALKESLTGRGLALIEAREGIELRTAPDTAPYVKKLRESELARDLGRAGLETLAVVLYRKGATRGEIDWIRGVNSSATVRSLLLRGLIDRIEDESDRRRFRYEVTVDALAHLGLSNVADAPSYEELSGAIAGAEKKQETTTPVEQAV